jgi:hypothetical protein
VKIRKAIQQMEAAEAADPELDLSEAKTAMALTAKSVAVEVVEEAQAAAGTPEEQEKVDQANDLLDEGDALLSRGRFPRGGGQVPGRAAEGAVGVVALVRASHRTKR